MTVECGLENLWKLKAIDSLETSNELPEEERQRIIDTLIDKGKLWDILHRK